MTMENNQKVSLISGGRGQDAAWLARLLLKEGQKVIAFERHVQSPNYENIQELLSNENYVLEKADVTDFGSVSRLVLNHKPDYFYHLAANSFVGCSWNEPMAVLNTNAGGTLNCLESIRLFSPKTKFLLASTSETVGNSLEHIQDENTPHTPRSPYAASKVFSEHICHIYRDSHKLWSAFTRCYNHESIFRGREFVTRKITDWIGRSFNTVEKNIDYISSGKILSVDAGFKAALEKGLISKLPLGNRYSQRDWLSAIDCVRAMKMIMDLDKPDDFVIASGKMHSIDDLLTIAFARIGIVDWEQFVEFSDKNKRPDDVITLCGNASKAKKILGWEPQITFKQMIEEMVEHDIEINRNV
jgi:GDPmannose 4,6-dehydratase